MMASTPYGAVIPVLVKRRLSQSLLRIGASNVVLNDKTVKWALNIRV